jgi:hypothetical protein
VPRRRSRYQKPTPTRRRTGPPLAFADPDVRKRFLDAVRIGTPTRYAASYAGMNEDTAYRALTVGRAAAQAEADGQTLTDPDDVLLAALWRETQRAKAAGSVQGLGLVAKAAQGGYVIRRRTRSWRDAATGRVVTEVEEDLAPVEWRASAWLLSHTVPEFAQVAQQVELTGAGGGPVEVRGDVEGLAARVAAAVAWRREQEQERERPGLPGGSGAVVSGEGTWSEG